MTRQDNQITEALTTRFDAKWQLDPETGCWRGEKWGHLQVVM